MILYCPEPASSNGVRHSYLRFTERKAPGMKTRVTVRVPATSANLGPGFDSLGMALDIWNTVHVEVGSSGLVIKGESSDSIQSTRSNMVCRSFRIPFRESGQKVPRARITCENLIPLGRGLGSSSAAVVAGLLAGNEVSGSHLSQQDILQIAARVEGHADNASPALLGGCQIVVREDGRILSAAVPIPDGLRAVIFTPEVPMSTKKARSLLSKNVSRGDAVYNIGRVALLVRAFATGDLTHMALATQDRLHQPARQALFPPMNNIFRAAAAAGALGVFLSGAGSSILALTSGKEVTIGYEMADAAAKSGIDGSVKVTRPTNLGARVVVSE
jgi:homoserine kinase